MPGKHLINTYSCFGRKWEHFRIDSIVEDVRCNHVCGPKTITTVVKEVANSIYWLHTLSFVSISKVYMMP